jgi:hypothetical protein
MGQLGRVLLAVVNAGQTSGRIVWGGLNAAGFAIINSVAYNLPGAAGGAADLEGHVMADALRHCATADEFEQYLQANLGGGLGCQTNFCVIDAHGGAAIFETHNQGYQRLEAGESPEQYLLNTNFSRTGESDAGAGYLRFDRESELFGALDGNAAASRTVVSGSLTGTLMAPTAVIWIRWSDPDVSGSDDGLAIDELSITAHEAPVPVVPSRLGAVKGAYC